MSGSLKPTSVASALLLAGFGGFAMLLAWRSLPWPLIHDVALMHYVAWRIADGAVPYRDLFDMNQPGTYLVHLAVLRTLGGGDLAWRVFDLAWLAATAGVIAVFAMPWGRVAAAAGALVFVTYHLAGGAWQAGQRDFLLCLFLLLGALGVARWLERGGVRSLLWSGAVLGAGITVKPHAALFAGPLAAFAAVLVAAELPAALAARRRLVAAALAASLVAALVLLGAKGLEASPATWWWDRERTVRTLEADLRARLAPGDTVQVLDTTEGGVHALFRLGVREPTRFLYDFHFFHDEDAPVVRALRAEFIRDLDARPPRMIVLFERGWPAGGYERVERFAALADRLRERYELAATRPGYRLYAKRHDP